MLHKRTVYCNVVCFFACCHQVKHNERILCWSVQAAIIAALSFVGFSLLRTNLAESGFGVNIMFFCLPQIVNMCLKDVFFVCHVEVSLFTHGNWIILQAWSITYHSWLTFVLLLWSSILWILPNQRHSMMRCSPFLVVYAMFLLLAQYIYGMDLTDVELPDQVKDVNLRQIGFIKTRNLPCEPLFIKVMDLI